MSRGETVRIKVAGDGDVVDSSLSFSCAGSGNPNSDSVNEGNEDLQQIFIQ